MLLSAVPMSAMAALLTFSSPVFYWLPTALSIPLKLEEERTMLSCLESASSGQKATIYHLVHSGRLLKFREPGFKGQE